LADHGEGLELKAAMLGTLLGQVNGRTWVLGFPVSGE